MEASELRVGNYIGVLHEAAPVKCDWLHIKEISEGASLYKQIPLTEEWLVKLGFTYCDSKIIGKGQKLSIQVSNLEALDYEDNEFFISNSSDNKVFSFWYDIKYVHQLQNLYFALTGEELTIKEPAL